MAIKYLENSATVGVNYSVVVDDKNDWNSVEADTIFFDLFDQTVYFKNSFGYVSGINDPSGESNISIYSYSEIELTSDDIQNLSSVGFILLDSGILNSNQYYDLSKVILEYIPGTTAFNFTGKKLFISSSNPEGISDSTKIFNSTKSTVTIFNFGPDSINGAGDTPPKDVQQSVRMSSDTDATEGDGTAVLKIWYKIRTLGLNPG